MLPKVASIEFRVMVIYMSHHHKKNQETVVSPEISYLLEDVEELVNNHIDGYLAGRTFSIKLNDFMPALNNQPAGSSLPVGINRLAASELNSFRQGGLKPEFVGMDLQFTFPIKWTDENPLNINLKWTDDISVRLALLDNRPLMLIEHGESVLKADQISLEEISTYLSSIGLPDSIFGQDFEDLFKDIYISRDMKIERSFKDIVDPSSTLEIVHNARHMINDDGEAELVQELCMNIDHYNEGRIDGGLYFPPTASYRSMLRFERSPKADKWLYRGLYSGELVEGELIDEPVQRDPKLGIPSDKLLDKALDFLSQNRLD